MSKNIVAIVCGLLTASLFASCEEEPNLEQPTEVQELPVDASLRDTLVVSGGELIIDVDGAGLLVPGSARVAFIGDVDGVNTAATLEASVEEGNSLVLRVSWDTLTAGLGVSGSSILEGTLEVGVDDLSGLVRGVGVIFDARIETVEGLTPELELDATYDIFINERTRVPGSGALRASEGTTRVRIEGTFTTNTGGSQAISEELALEPATGPRTELELHWPPWLFGVQPGSFTGTLTPVNAGVQGGDREGTARNVTVNLQQTELDGFNPPVASRGQIVEVLGRGFFPPDAERGFSMFLRFEGTFTTAKGTVLQFTGADAVQLAPESVDSHTTARIALRSEIVDRGGRLELVGLTSTPGVFEGDITPVLIAGGSTVEAQSLSGTFTIGPTQQKVFVKFLPSYVDALEGFGLRNVEPEIRDRIFEVLARDYAGFHIEFDDERPRDFVEYSVIEVGGPDPNGAGLFGLDNTAGKDTGNIRLNDIVGSQNAESVENGFYSFGGVFIDSFRTFSPTLDKGSEIASQEFDDIFSPFMPALGGSEIDGSEWPDGPRTAEIQLAIHALGSIIGNTVGHEIGHSLGLSFFQEDLFTTSSRFHNDFDEPGAIMDGGAFRPFAERAELSGADLPTFNTRNRDYLEDILPLP